MTKLDFLKEHFKNYTVTVTEPDNDDPYAKIDADADSEPVTVYYESDDCQPYTVCFSYQHVHCFNETDAVECAEAFLSGKKSAIEFFIGDRPCFGGDIEGVLPDAFTTEFLKGTPFGDMIFSRPVPEGLSFRVRSANKAFCFDGKILPDQTITVIPAASMPVILITAFEPFGGSRRNSSLDTLSALPGTIGNCTVKKLVLPVVFDRCADILCEKIAEISPEAVICLGQAQGRGMITPEYIAVNVKHAASADNAGQTFSLEPILSDGPDAYITTLPADAMVEEMKKAGIPASISFTAGTYVCNNLMYHAIHHCKANGIHAGFIHLPLSYEIAAEENKAGHVLTLPQKTLTDGIITAARVLCCQRS